MLAIRPFGARAVGRVVPGSRSAIHVILIAVRNSRRSTAVHFAGLGRICASRLVPRRSPGRVAAGVRIGLCGPFVRPAAARAGAQALRFVRIGVARRSPAPTSSIDLGGLRPPAEARLRVPERQAASVPDNSGDGKLEPGIGEIRTGERCGRPEPQADESGRVSH